ncbi:hypothetical protein SODG_003639 [Sodalis praecaptivus]|nr:hypothetical protein NVIRENTERO_00557 [Sodalis praecaptivus]
MIPLLDQAGLRVGIIKHTYHKDPSLLDVILVEGFKHEPVSKIALYRSATGQDWRTLLDRHVIAIASDVPLDCALLQLNFNQPAEIARFIMTWLGRS